MKHLGGGKERVARLQRSLRLTDSHLERALGNVGRLAVRMIVQRPDGAGLESHSNEHEVGPVRQDLSRHAFRDRLPR